MRWTRAFRVVVAAVMTARIIRRELCLQSHSTSGAPRAAALWPMPQPAPRNDPANPPRVSVYIIAFNEAEKIRDAVSSVLWADEIIVADSHSTDGTIEIAEQ